MTDPRRPTDSVLARYLSSECTPEEARAVEQWLEEDAANPQELERLASAWERSRETAEMRAPDIEAFWQRVRTRIQVPRPSDVRVVRRPRNARISDRHRQSRWSIPMRVAAAIALVSGAGLAGRALFHAPSEHAAELTYNVVSTTRGQRLSVRLADGTLVALAPGTTMRAPSTYGLKDRTVQLEGEAAFSVIHDSTRPFAVETRLAVARDLGTRFLVRAYAGDSLTDVVVAEGLVAVGRVDSAEAGPGAPLSSDSLVITRGERVRVGPAGSLSLTRDVPLDRYFGWTEGRLVFRRTPLGEAIAQIERWYDIEIGLAPSVRGERGVTATFGEYEPAAQVLQVIATVLEVEVVQTGAAKYTLRAKQ